MIHYAWEVKMNRYDRNGAQVDTSTFTVSAKEIAQACAKGLKQARSDSGFKSEWRVVSAVRGPWLVA